MKPIIYQIFTRLFGNATTTCKKNGSLFENGCGKFSSFDNVTLKRIRELGITHIWYTGIIRHATCTDYSKYNIPRQHPNVIKGKAGSPYAITDYYDVNPDLSDDIEHRMQEFEALIERTHKAGLKVIIDFVPNHVARQYRSICRPRGVKDLGEEDDTSKHFSPSNNFYYCWGRPFSPHLTNIDSGIEPYYEVPAKATGNDCFSASPGCGDWYETVKLNYGVDYCNAAGRSCHFAPIPDTWHKMVDILLFWASKGIDCFRCDMAEMVPVDFWTWSIEKIKQKHSNITFIGEVYDPNLYHSLFSSGFDWLYDKVGMYDCLRDVICSFRPANAITRQWQNSQEALSSMVYFLENHDEQRIASSFFASDAQRGIPGVIVSVLLGTNPFLLYAGQEYGERGMDEEGFSGLDGRTTIYDYWSLRSIQHGYYDRHKLTKHERNIEKQYKSILNVAKSEKAIIEGAFFDLTYANSDISQCVFTFLRKAENDLLFIAANFSKDSFLCSINIPEHAFSHLSLPKGNYNAVDLLTKETATLRLSPDDKIETLLPSYGGRVWKITF